MTQRFTKIFYLLRVLRTKKQTLAQVFSCEFCEISKNTFFTEHLRLHKDYKNFLVESQDTSVLKYPMQRDDYHSEKNFCQ